jgi:hypothetical protein
MARKLKIKIPKRVAGMKIPKAVRKGPIRDFLNSSAGQLLMAEGLIVLSGALAAKKADPNSPMGKFVHHPLDSMRNLSAAGASDALGHESSKLSNAFSEAIRAFRGALDEPPRADDESTTQDAGEVMTGDLQTEPERPKKKPSGSRSGTQSTPH